MIVNTFGRKCWFERYVMSGRVASECRCRVDEVENRVGDVLDDNRDEEWKRLDYLFEDLEDEIKDLRANLEVDIDSLKANYEQSLVQLMKLVGPCVSKDRFSNLLFYTSEVSRLADICTQEVSLIDEQYDELCIRRKAHFVYRLGMWRAHYRLFCAGAYVSGAAFPALKVGTHCFAEGEIETQVKFGTYVHVDEDDVYADGCMSRIAGIDYDDDIPFGPRRGIIKIGKLMDNINPECRSFSAIVWKKTYDRVDGLDDDDYMDEDTYDFRELHYELVVLGSSEVLLYDQWDTIYSPLKEYVRRRVIDADSSDDDDDEVFDADSSDEEDDA
jgi:hypothetical protein